MKIKPSKEDRAFIKQAAHNYANPKTKVLQSYCRLHDAFQAGVIWAMVNIRTGVLENNYELVDNNKKGAALNNAPK